MGADKKAAATALDAICNVTVREVAGGGAVTLPDDVGSVAWTVPVAFGASSLLAATSISVVLVLLVVLVASDRSRSPAMR